MATIASVPGVTGRSAPAAPRGSAPAPGRRPAPARVASLDERLLAILRDPRPTEGGW